MITSRETIVVRLIFAALLTGSGIIRLAEGTRCYACTNPAVTSEICNGNDTDHPTNEIIKNCGSSGCIEKFRRSPNSTLATFSRGCSREGAPFKCTSVEGCSDLSTDIRHICTCGTDKCNKNLPCFTGTRNGKSSANSELISNSFLKIIMIVFATKTELSCLLSIFIALLISSAEGVRCYVCPNPGSISKTCIFNDTVADPINEIVEECANGCFEKFHKDANSSGTFARGCERHYGPLKCWDVDGCSDFETDKKHTCSCGTDLCNKNLPCFTGEKDPPVTPSSGNSVLIKISISLFIIILIFFH